MLYTGHKNKHMINGENIVDFIRFDMKQDSKLFWQYSTTNQRTNSPSN